MKSRILIIDDDQDFVQATQLLLESEGYDVITAGNGQEGFKKVKSQAPDLILMDMMMTYKTEGAETAKAMASDAAIRDIPIIMITGARQDMGFSFDIKPDQMDLPVKVVIEKPIKPENFLSTIKAYITDKVVERKTTVTSLDDLAKKWDGKRGTLIMILHEIQNRYGYVPRNISFELSRLLEIPLARIYEVITFYNYFKLDPPGEHIISICMGTACYLKGTPDILEEIKNILHIEEGETTKDGLFHLQTVRCVGCCGLAPVILIDQEVYGKVKKEEVLGILSKYSNPAQEAVKE